MEVTSDQIITKVRNLLGDILKDEIDIFTYGSSNVFTLTEDNIASIEAVLVNDVELGSGDYSYSSTTNKLAIDGSGVAVTGDTVEVRMSCYRNYSDNEITGAINASMVHISVAGYGNYELLDESGSGIIVSPEPEEKDANLIALIASIVLEPNNLSYKLPDLSVTVPNNSAVSQTLESQIKRIIASVKKLGQGYFDTL